MKDHSKMSILICSCDAYEDLWRPCINLFDRYWPHVPYPVFLGTETKSLAHPRVKSIQAGPGRHWSCGLRSWIESINSEYILLMLEDFFLRKPVIQSKISAALDFATSTNAHQVRLVPLPPPTRRRQADELFGECESGARYRVSTQAAIWRSESLLELLLPEENIWQFEHKGTERSLKHKSGHYAAYRPLLPYVGIISHHVVEKGCWLSPEVALLKLRGVSCDFSKRPVLGVGRTLNYYAARMVSGALKMVHKVQRENLRIAIRRLIWLANKRWLTNVSPLFDETTSSRPQTSNCRHGNRRS
jgi:hypothetical protein